MKPAPQPETAQEMTQPSRQEPNELELSLSEDTGDQAGFDSSKRDATEHVVSDSLDNSKVANA